MKFRPKNYKENLTKLMELSYRLNSMIKDGSFYELSFLDRYREVRKIKSLYNKLRGPVSDAHLKQAVSFAAVLMLITGARCSDTSVSGYANVTIDLGLRDKDKAVTSMTKGPAPKSVTGISLTVTGPGMDEIVQPVDVTTGMITLDVPAGDDRVFSVRADTATMDYYTGSATEDLEAGENADVDIMMALQKFTPSFVKRAENPFGLTGGAGYPIYPSFADIDGDGDLDLFTTTYGSGDTSFFKNLSVESGGTPSFEAPASASSLYNLNSDIQFKTFVDIDGDGDLDVVSSGVYSGSPYTKYNMIFTHTNIGMYFQPPSVAIPDPFPFEDASSFNYKAVNFYNPIMSFADIDNDGDPDLLVGGVYPYPNGSPGNMQYLENIDASAVFGTPQDNPFGLRAITTQQLPDLYDVSILSPAFVDIDGDGDYDLFAGVGWRDNPGSAHYFNDILFFENTGTPNTPSFAAPVLNPFGITGMIDGKYISEVAFAFPAFADIDRDGDQDLFVGDGYGNIQYYENQALGTPDTTPPADVTGLTGNPMGEQVELTWTDPSDSDFTRVLITFTPEADGVDQPIEVPKGTSSAFIGNFITSGRYTFTVRSVDGLGNQSRGASVPVDVAF